MKFVTKFLLLAFAFALSLCVHAQTPSSKNYYAAIKNYDLSKIWRGEKINVDEGEMASFPEPLGFIGDTYQRFYIHYIMVTKNKQNPYVYNVNGKTMVKNNICNFSGTITIEKASINEPTDNTGLREGTVVCKIVFNEDQKESSSGFFNGRLTSNFYMDKGKIFYNSLNIVSDGYANNQCEATWTSYKTTKSKKCNWGDFRIPDCDDLDMGAGEFSVNDKYIKLGWATYMEMFSADEQKAAKAQQAEKKKWWK